MEAIQWFQAHAGDIWIAVSSVIATASIIVKITPTPKDDAVLAKIVGFISKFVALNKQNPN